jgi:hypothetical protein
MSFKKNITIADKKFLIESILNKEAIYSPSIGKPFLIGLNRQIMSRLFLICSRDGRPGKLGLEEFHIIFEEARKNKLKPPYKVYAGYSIYPTKLVTFIEI